MYKFMKNIHVIYSFLKYRKKKAKLKIVLNPFN